MIYWTTLGLWVITVDTACITVLKIQEAWAQPSAPKHCLYIMRGYHPSHRTEMGISMLYNFSQVSYFSLRYLLGSLKFQRCQQKYGLWMGVRFIMTHDIMRFLVPQSPISEWSIKTVCGVDLFLWIPSSCPESLNTASDGVSENLAWGCKYIFKVTVITF